MQQTAKTIQVPTTTTTTTTMMTVTTDFDGWMDGWMDLRPGTGAGVKFKIRSKPSQVKSSQVKSSPVDSIHFQA